MPELPEVETIARELREKIINEVFSNVERIWSRSLVAEDGLSLTNCKIQAIDRKGKYLIFLLDKHFLITHLRMTGQLIVSDSKPDNDQHLRVIFRFKSGKYLLFYDLRKFGRIFLTNDPQKVLKNIGVDAISEEFTPDKFLEILNEKKTKVKSFLLDQRNIAGLGNIYIDESLFESQIHPETIINNLDSDRREKLYNVIRKTLYRSIEKMGTTISDYKTTGGGFGENQDYLKVYQRQNQPCLVCKATIEKTRVNGRGTHFCPQCQKKIS